MARMAQTSSVPFIRSVNRNLTALTMSAKVEDRPEQTAAVERLKKVVDGAQAVIGQMTSATDADDTSVEIFTVLSTQRAVWKYLARHPLRVGRRDHTRFRAAVLHGPSCDCVRSERQEQSDAAICGRARGTIGKLAVRQGFEF